MGYVLVQYDRRRIVFIDGEWAGYTNEELRVANGVHDFDLGEPPNVDPVSYHERVRSTHTMQRPLELQFVRVDQ
jgi:hypothetical protein